MNIIELSICALKTNLLNKAVPLKLRFGDKKKLI